MTPPSRGSGEPTRRRTGTEDWDPRSAPVLRDPRAAYDAMRSRCPVAYSDFLGWTVFRHQEVLHILHDPETFSNAVSSHLSVPNGLDPPEHQAYRSLIEPYFADDVVAGFEPVCRAAARRRVAALVERREADAMADFARPLAAAAQCAFLGWPASMAEPLIEWTLRNQQATFDRDRPALKELADAFREHVSAQLEARRAPDAPRDDVTACLMREEVHGRELSEEELVSVLRNWTVGEIGTLSAALGIIIHGVLERPELQARLRRDPAAIPAANEELLRLHGPLVDNRRIATRPVTLDERRIERGDRITLNWIAANRDPEAFDAPDCFRPERDGKNLLWGAGIHVCPGASLARMEMRVAVEELLHGSSRLAVAPEGGAILARYPASGYAKLPVVLRG